MGWVKIGEAILKRDSRGNPVIKLTLTWDQLDDIGYVEGDTMEIYVYEQDTSQLLLFNRTLRVELEKKGLLPKKTTSSETTSSDQKKEPG